MTIFRTFSRWVDCPDCSGRGVVNPEAPPPERVRCASCRGEGRVASEARASKRALALGEGKRRGGGGDEPL